MQKGALNIVLQFTNTAYNRRLFLEAGVVPLLMKYAFAKELRSICLTNLINLSSDVNEDYITEPIQEQFRKTAEPLLLQFQEWELLEKELCMLYMTNVSKIEAVSLGVIVGEGDKEGYFVLKLLWTLANDNRSKLYHIANILANVSSFKPGRDFLIKRGG